MLLTHAYVHLLADVHLVGFAPAFTLSFHDSEYARKPPVPIASVVSVHTKDKRQNTIIKNKSFCRKIENATLNIKEQ